MRFRRPSPALVISLIALFVALGGVSYAAVKISTKQLKNQAVTSAKIKNRTILKRDIRPNVVRALKGRRGPAGPAGPQGPAGPAGPQGAPGTAVAYALVTASGTVEPNAPVKGITSAMITHPATGVYCFRNLPAGATIAVVSANNTGGNDTIASLYTNNTGNIVGCDIGAGDRFRVRTYDVSGAALADRPFVIWFDS